MSKASAIKPREFFVLEDDRQTDAPVHGPMLADYDEAAIESLNRDLLARLASAQRLAAAEAEYAAYQARGRQ